MQTNQYIALATKTESVPTELKINQTVLHASLLLAIAAGNVLDQVKRRLFYGKPLQSENLEDHLQKLLAMTSYIGIIVNGGDDEEGQDQELAEANRVLSAEELESSLPSEILGTKLENLNIRLLHAAIGGFTENGEKLEALIKQYETGELDLVNYREENGDTQWYNAIELDELAKLAVGAGLNPVDYSEAGIRLANITKLQGNEKLKGRYAAGDFDAVAALNRDLANERAILESSVAKVAA